MGNLDTFSIVLFFDSSITSELSFEFFSGLISFLFPELSTKLVFETEDSTLLTSVPALPIMAKTLSTGADSPSFNPICNNSPL